VLVFGHSSTTALPGVWTLVDYIWTTVATSPGAALAGHRDTAAAFEPASEPFFSSRRHD